MAAKAILLAVALVSVLGCGPAEEQFVHTCGASEAGGYSVSVAKDIDGASITSMNAIRISDDGEARLVSPGAMYYVTADGDLRLSTSECAGDIKHVIITIRYD